VKRVEEYGKKLDALDIEALNSLRSSGITHEGENGISVDLQPIKDEIESMKSDIQEIEKKVDLILKSTNRHLDVIEKNLKAEIEKLKKVKAQRDYSKVEEKLKDLENAARENKNIIPYIYEAVKTYATLQEITDVLRNVFGEYKASTIL